MTIISSLLSSVWGPILLVIPSPALPFPANWLIPVVLWLAIFVYFISLIRSEHLAWLWEKSCQLLNRLQKWSSEKLDYPEPKPLGNILGEFLFVVCFCMFALYFFAFGTTLLFMVISYHTKASPIVSISVMLLGMLFLLIGRFYMVKTIKGKLKLVAMWNDYPNNKPLAVAAIFAVMFITGLVVWFAPYSA